MKSGFTIYDDFGNIQVSDVSIDLGLEKIVNLSNNPKSGSIRPDPPDTSKKLHLVENKIYALEPNRGIVGQVFGYGGYLGISAVGTRDSKAYVLGYEHNESLNYSSYGLQLFDENGNIAYTSNKPSVKIIDHVTAKFNRGWDIIVKDYGTRDIAVIFNKTIFVRDATSLNYGNLVGPWWSTGVYFDGSGRLVITPTVFQLGAGSDSPVIYSKNVDFLIIDTSIYK